MEVTRRCIESVLDSRCRTPFELVVVDDASPEPELSAWQDEQAAAGREPVLSARQPAAALPGCGQYLRGPADRHRLFRAKIKQPTRTLTRPAFPLRSTDWQLLMNS
jgi:hypothetical protein